MAETVRFGAIGTGLTTSPGAAAGYLLHFSKVQHGSLAEALVVQDIPSMVSLARTMLGCRDLSEMLVLSQEVDNASSMRQSSGRL